MSEEETVADICKNSGRNSAHKSNWLRLHIFAYYLAESYVESANFLWVVKFILLEYNKGTFKYYVIKEVGGLGQKMAIFDDLQ